MLLSAGLKGLRSGDGTTASTRRNNSNLECYFYAVSPTLLRQLNFIRFYPSLKTTPLRREVEGDRRCVLGAASGMAPARRWIWISTRGWRRRGRHLLKRHCPCRQSEAGRQLALRTGGGRRGRVARCSAATGRASDSVRRGRPGDSGATCAGVPRGRSSRAVGYSSRGTRPRKHPRGPRGAAVSGAARQPAAKARAALRCAIGQCGRAVRRRRDFRL